MNKGHLGRSVSIISAAYTPLGNVQTSPEILNFSERELVAMASIEAMQGGNINAKDIDACYVGMSGPNYDAKLKSGGPFFADWVGMRNKPTFFHDEGCGSQAGGLHLAVMAVASGLYDCVLSTAVNISKSVPKPAYPPHIRGQQDPDVLWGSLWTGSDAAYQKPGFGGVTPLEAVLVRYAAENNLTYEELDQCFVNYLVSKRKEALLNPKAVLVKETYEEEAKRFGFDNVKDYLFSNKFNPKMGTLIRSKFLGATVDGASSIIVCSTEKAKQLVKKPIEVVGISSATTLEKACCELPSVVDVIMFKEAYAMAGITDPNKEVEYMGIHDCPATMILPVSEAAGYFKPGEAFKYMTEGRLCHDSDKPISTSGGRTQSGHPRSPAFAIEVAEAISQMRGENGPRQMKNPPKISAVWGGGSGFFNGVCVLKTL